MVGRKQQFFLERGTDTADAVGGRTKAWSTIVSFKGVISSFWGDEKIKYDKETLIADYVIKTDYNAFLSGITEVDAIRLKGILFDVKFVDNVDEMNQVLNIYVEKRK